jgi:hypothetical protein
MVSREKIELTVLAMANNPFGQPPFDRLRNKRSI